MKNVLKILTSFLLLVNGIGAIYGGANLILYPDGSSIQLSPDWLKHAPFDDYFIPGIILFIMNGLFSIIVFVFLILNHRKYSFLTMVQGVILMGWIIIQIILMQTIHILHVLLGSVGLALIILGWIQKESDHAQ